MDVIFIGSCPICQKFTEEDGWCNKCGKYTLTVEPSDYMETNDGDKCEVAEQ